MCTNGKIRVSLLLILLCRMTPTARLGWMLCIVHTYVYSSVWYTCRYDESLLHGVRCTLALYNRPIIRGRCRLVYY